MNTAILSFIDLQIVITLRFFNKRVAMFEDLLLTFPFDMVGDDCWVREKSLTSRITRLLSDYVHLDESVVKLESKVF